MRSRKYVRQRSTRSAFTLAELLIVIVILLMLLALSMSAVYKGYNAVYRMNTTTVLGKIQYRVDRRYDQIRKELISWDVPVAFGTSGTPTAFIDSANGLPWPNQRQAKMIQMKYLVKWSFPYTYREAFLNMWESRALYGPTGHPFAAAIYRAVQQKLPGYNVDTTTNAWPTTPPNPLPPEPATLAEGAVENSALLAIVYSLMPGNGNDEFAANEIANGNDLYNSGLRVLIDAWGTPLLMDRWPGTAAATGISPFGNGGGDQRQAYWRGLAGTTPPLLQARAMLAFPLKFQANNGLANYDPDDPERLLAKPTVTGTQWQSLDLAINFTSPVNIRTTFSQVAAPDGFPFYPQYAPLVIVSAGPDKVLGPAPPPPVTALTIFGYGEDDLDTYTWRLNTQASQQ